LKNICVLTLLNFAHKSCDVQSTPQIILICLPSQNTNLFQNDLSLQKGKNMERNQKINCTVASCKYNNTENAECILKAIHVSPMEGCETKKPDESMCASYENQTK